ncbi:DUF4238 domain-containing protein [Pantoea sp. CTOTU50773]|uniref:DUF4238 domain-containing protein n=1 Tax=Pantoea sp. CTOTU50773 TaxID=2953853 RepID=UPI0028A5F477|nr:DUF4238 domain-containing protein [Pantoea sp. CTOTU50773]
MKKKQHYVFRDYLRAWADKDIIHASRLGVDFRVNLSGVAQERFFYELSELTEDDFVFIKDIVIGPLDNDLAKLNMGWFKPLILMQQMKQNLISRGIFNGEIHDEINGFFKEAQEELHCEIESAGIPLLAMLKNKDLSFYDDVKLRAGFCHFLAVQYFRTKKLKVNFLKLSKKDSRMKFENTWGLISHVYATNVGLAIFREKYKFVLLVQEGEIEFITSDQPVINVLSHLASNPTQDDIELYYPVSPEIALLVTNKESYENKSINLISSGDVNDFNEMLKKHSNEFIFFRK